MRNILIIALMLVGFVGQAQSQLGINPNWLEYLEYSPLIILVIAFLVVWLWLALILSPLFIWKWTKRTAKEINALTREIHLMNSRR